MEYHGFPMLLLPGKTEIYKYLGDYITEEGNKLTCIEKKDRKDKLHDEKCDELGGRKGYGRNGHASEIFVVGNNSDSKPFI